MNYHEIFESLGFKYMGRCKCRYEKGYIYRHPVEQGVEFWIYPKPKKIKKRVFDTTKEVVPYTDETMETVIKALSNEVHQN